MGRGQIPGARLESPIDILSGLGSFMETHLCMALSPARLPLSSPPFKHILYRTVTEKYEPD